MSVTVSKADGVTVLTVVSDPNGRLPPLCQILKVLCRSLAGCSVPPHLKQVQTASLLILGTLHILIGLLSFSLGIILHFSESCCRLIDVTSFPYWSGVLFVIFGVISILCEKKPCLYLIFLNVFLNLVGIFGAVGAIVFYSINMTGDYGPCWNVNGSFGHNNCSDTVLSIGVDGVLVGLSALELSVAISSLVLAMKVLKSFKRNENLMSSEPDQTTDPEITEVPYEICIISS